ncbi:putative arabinose efflux permease, MFS family [Nostoc flagelliforme CCNUN1]|uniref:Putative arabinose efflux permease, MFS family n=1 Tax=Nostoc flagelliforme CCNUN1 TaxID=2038116 RepID=A0A2K8SNJ2_9NOSO|nr:putative arabinose efflux permease, MFS family [Nostoc flagelliforme CCNUN1]
MEKQILSNTLTKVQVLIMAIASGVCVAQKQIINNQSFIFRYYCKTSPCTNN